MCQVEVTELLLVWVQGHTSVWQQGTKAVGLRLFLNTVDTWLPNPSAPPWIAATNPNLEYQHLPPTSSTQKECMTLCCTLRYFQANQRNRMPYVYPQKLF